MLFQRVYNIFTSGVVYKEYQLQYKPVFLLRYRPEQVGPSE